MSDVTRAEICAVAVGEAFRGDGEMWVSPIGLLPQIGAKLAKASFEPDLLMTDGVAPVVANVLPTSGDAKVEPVVEGWLPYRTVFDLLWSGRRHVMMGATQIDVFGNQNIACIGDYAKPKAQLLGMRGAPGNTINHPTSYWIPNHSTKTFVHEVDVVSGIGYDRARKLGPVASRFHELRRVVTNLAVLDFQSPENRMHLVSVHPGTTVDEVVEQTSFELVIDGNVPESRMPTDEELRLLREVIDPKNFGGREVQG